VASWGASGALAAQAAPQGKAVYDKWCAGCHGDTGAGDGPAALYMLPRPRDFTKGVYQIRTTASGELPTDADLMKVISDGMPGTAMPEWESRLTEAERTDVLAYVKGFSAFFKGAKPKLVTIGKAPSSSAATIADGRKAYEKLECFKCHGHEGRGDGPSSPTLKDDYNQPIRAADLSQGWTFNGGATVDEIYARLRTGLDGTPMPSFSDAIDSKVITDEELWHVAQYVHSLSPSDAVREVVRAAPAEHALPRVPNDSVWSSVEKFWVPMVGQIIQKPRWFAPAVTGVWVQALHDGVTLALRVSWHDRSPSPDTTWGQWMTRMVPAMTDVDGAISAAQGPDRLTVQFPLRRTDETESPYFLGGSTRQPVYVWRWSSAPEQADEGTGTGLGKVTPLARQGALTQAAAYKDGEWAVQFTRALVSTDSTVAPSFTVARAIPIAFQAADGSNGEDGVRGSVSAWYAIYLDVPTPPRVYVAPAATMLLTAGLGFLAVLQAQRRGRDARDSNREG
jgi:mono/diheme cytochrome c family protein